METIEQETARWIRSIRRTKIQTPRPDQYVDHCHFSKTGWAIWNANGGCTCVPAKRPWGSERRTMGRKN